MPDICLYCQVHQPYRLARYRLFDVGSGRRYCDDEENRRILRRVAEKCYVPVNRLLADLIRRSGGGFRLALSISGTLLDQMAESAPDALESFQDLVETGGVELLGETYYHSLSTLADVDESREQVRLHGQAIDRWFGRRPVVFRNTELIYFDALAPVIAEFGFRGALVEGASHILGWRSANYVYEAAHAPGLRLLPRNYSLSDDVGFRFSNRHWTGWPLTADKYADWIAASPGDSVHLFMDYETFGEHQWADTGIFDFLRHLPDACFGRGLGFLHPATLAARPPVAPLSFAQPTSWADIERDVSAWLGNRLQRAAHERLYRMRPAVPASGDAALLAAWRKLTTSDHLYYMCTKWFADGDVHKYFNPYATPYDAFIAFMNVLQDVERRLSALARDAAVADVVPPVGEMACVA